MDSRSTGRNTCLFIVFLLLAGIANTQTFIGIPGLEALMTECNYLIYVGLLLFWALSVRSRLLPSRSRTYMRGAALMMLLYQLLRVFKYRFTVGAILMRYEVYLYFVPMTMIPTLFLMTCLRISRGPRTARFDEALLLIPEGLLCLIAVTNDLHKLVYVPEADLSVFAVDSGTYTHGPFFYALYAWMILSFATGLILLLRETARLRGKALFSLLAVVAVWFCMILTYNLFYNGVYGPRMYNNPEIHVFGMLGVLEVCIRYRLIPHNTNYADFFAVLQMPALVTDRALNPVYRSGRELSADTDQLRSALVSPEYLTPDLRLTGRAIRGGYAFWAEDETEIHRAQERLAEANELIESENSLIRAETEQREKDAWLQSQHRIYHEIAETMYPVQQRIERLLGGMEPGTPEFRDRLAYVSVLNAYVKRKTNLLLLAAEKDTLTTHDLFLALQESASYLSQAGLKTDAQPSEEKTYPAGRVIALYDAFESITEQLIGTASSLMVSWKGDVLTLAMESAHSPDLTGLPVRVLVREEEGIRYLNLPAEEGGEQA